MDDETRAAFAALDRRLEEIEGRILARFNAIGERLGDRPDDTGVLYSMLKVNIQRWIDLDRRVRKLEGDR